MIRFGRHSLDYWCYRDLASIFLSRLSEPSEEPDGVADLAGSGLGSTTDALTSFTSDFTSDLATASGLSPRRETMRQMTTARIHVNPEMYTFRWALKWRTCRWYDTTLSP